MTGHRRSYLLKVSEPYVMVPARIAALIESRTNISALRVQTRGLDSEATAVLEDFRNAAMSWSPVSRRETEEDRSGKPAPESEVMTTTEVAEVLGLTRQAIGKAIKAGRLQATKTKAGAYRITRENFEHYRAARAA